MTQKHTDKIKVVIHDADPEPLVQQLKAAHDDVVIKTCDSYDGLAETLNRFQPDVVYTIRFAGSTGFPAKALLGASGPKWISVGGSGVDHLGHWDTQKVTVTNSAGVAASMMAEYVLGSALNFTLDIPDLLLDKQKRVWPPRIMSPLRGQNMLIVGLGHTGQAVAALAKAFGMTVTGTRARPAPTKNVDHVHSGDKLDRLWGEADVVVVSAPLLESTKGLIDHNAFAAMKSGVILVDVSRGGIVKEDALISAVQSGKLKGAALDVFETEPLPKNSEVWNLPNLIISPHCSSVYNGWEAASMQLFCENLKRWKNYEPLVNIVDPSRGY